MIGVGSHDTLLKGNKYRHLSNQLLMSTTVSGVCVCRAVRLLFRQQPSDIHVYNTKPTFGNDLLSNQFTDSLELFRLSLPWLSKASKLSYYESVIY